MSAYDQCREQGIRLKSYSVGDYRTTCPKCSHLRKKAHQRVPCLAVTIKSDSTLWHCHHCGWEGGSKNDQEVERNFRRLHGQTARSIYR